MRPSLVAPIKQLWQLDIAYANFGVWHEVRMFCVGFSALAISAGEETIWNPNLSGLTRMTVEILLDFGIITLTWSGSRNRMIWYDTFAYSTGGTSRIQHGRLFWRFSVFQDTLWDLWKNLVSCLARKLFRSGRVSRQSWMARVFVGRTSVYCCSFSCGLRQQSQKLSLKLCSVVVCGRFLSVNSWKINKFKQAALVYGARGTKL